MGLVRNVNENGVMKSVFRVSDDKEAHAYQSFVDMTMPKCPRCYTELKLAPDDMLFEINNPLTQTMGMDLATCTPICPKCRGQLSINEEMDLDMAFPTAVNTLKKARKNYEELKAKRSGAKGGTNGKR